MTFFENIRLLTLLESGSFDIEFCLQTTCHKTGKWSKRKELSAFLSFQFHELSSFNRKKILETFCEVYANFLPGLQLSSLVKFELKNQHVRSWVA